jgi:hypothetical protein
MIPWFSRPKPSPSTALSQDRRISLSGRGQGTHIPTDLGSRGDHIQCRSPGHLNFVPGTDPKLYVCRGMLSEVGQAPQSPLHLKHFQSFVQPFA